MALTALIFAALVATSVAAAPPDVPAVTDKGLSQKVESVHGHGVEVPPSPVDGSNVVHSQAQLRQGRFFGGLGYGSGFGGYGGGFGGGYGGGFGGYGGGFGGGYGGGLFGR